MRGLEVLSRRNNILRFLTIVLVVEYLRQLHRNDHPDHDGRPLLRHCHRAHGHPLLLRPGTRLLTIMVMPTSVYEMSYEF